jgi:protease-4
MIDVGRAIRTASLAAATLLAGGCFTIQLFGGPPEPLVETVIHGDSGPKILMLEIDGLIAEDPGDSGFLGRRDESPVARVREQLDRARSDSQVKALLLRINSPGGTVTASDIIHREIQRFKRDRGVPVVAHFLGTATSGAYYVAMSADHVIAHPTTVTGSIGVIFVGLNFAGLMDKLGIENATMTAGEFKDAGSPLRPMSSEERAQLQSVLDAMHTVFKERVAEGRPELDAKHVDALSDGRIYAAVQALENGLVDAIGDLEAAVAETERRAGLSSSRVVSYHRPREWRPNLYGRPLVPAEVTLKLESPLGRLGRPGFFYLWAPGLGLN